MVRTTGPPQRRGWHNSRVEPRIQYATADDGASIAFWALGEGVPLVIMPAVPFSHLQLEWQMPEWRAFFERLAARYRVVRYDPRGMGLSDRDTGPMTFDTHLADLEAVVEHLGLERFAIMAIAHAGPVAIQYAAAFPVRVSHLVLWCSYHRNTAPPPDKDWERPLLNASFRLYTETIASSCAGSGAPEAACALAGLVREAVTPAAMASIIDTFRGIDVSEAMPHVVAPTLVIHRSQVAVMDPKAGLRLAQRLPGARLVMLDGDSIAPFLNDPAPVFAALEDFLPPSAGPQAEVLGGLRIIIFTDVQAHTEMMSRLGDAAGREVLRDHERITREALLAYGGSEVKSMGDGFLASFTSVQSALDCAVSLQRAFAERPGEPIRIRIGMNAGEPIAEEHDLFGTSVIAAARVASQAAGGEILVTDVVRQLVAGKGFLFGGRGEVALKGMDEAVRIWELNWREV